MSERGHRRCSAARCSSSTAPAVNSSGSTSGMNRDGAAGRVDGHQPPAARDLARLLFPRRVAVDDGEALVVVPGADDVDHAAIREGRHRRARHAREGRGVVGRAAEQLARRGEDLQALLAALAVRDVPRDPDDAHDVPVGIPVRRLGDEEEATLATDRRQRLVELARLAGFHDRRVVGQDPVGARRREQLAHPGADAVLRRASQPCPARAVDHQIPPGVVPDEEDVARRLGHRAEQLMALAHRQLGTHARADVLQEQDGDGIAAGRGEAGHQELEPAVAVRRRAADELRLRRGRPARGPRGLPPRPRPRGRGAAPACP